MSLISYLRRDENTDDLSGLPLCEEKRAWDSIRQLLLDAGAARPHLNYFGALPKQPPSPYIASAPQDIQLSTVAVSKGAIESADAAEAAYLEAKAKDADRFELVNGHVKVKVTISEPEAVAPLPSEGGDRSHKRTRLPDELELPNKRHRFVEAIEQPPGYVSVFAPPSDAPFELGSAAPAGAGGVALARRPSAAPSVEPGFSFHSSGNYSLPPAATAAPASSPEAANLPNFNVSNEQNAARFHLPSLAAAEPHHKVAALEAKLAGTHSTLGTATLFILYF
jgi:hypothetical protein